MEKREDKLLNLITYMNCKGIQFEKENPKPYIDKVIIGCNHAGIPASETIEYIQRRSKLDFSLVESAVNELYVKHVDEFGIHSIMYNLQARNNFDDDWQNMPYIPDEVYDNLPKILTDGTTVFNEKKRERDLFLTGAITVISGMMPNIFGTYQTKNMYPNLFCFIIAPAGSGKSSLLFAKQMGLKVHENIMLLDKNQSLFIPGNISTAALYEQLVANGGQGILFESEADTLKNTFKQDWGGYSDLLRKAYQHEPITLKRKKNSPLEINQPKISVILSGTPNQVIGVIPSSQNGLFSRFIFYVFESDLYWNKAENISLDNYFDNLSKDIFSIICKLKNISKFNLTDNQLNIFNNRFEKIQEEFVLFFDRDNISIIRRMGLITFRMAMILACLRYAENKETIEPNTFLECTDVDFNIAFSMMNTYLQHSLCSLVAMTKNKNNLIEKNVLLFYEALPNSEFTRADAINIVKDKNLNIAERTIDKYLKKLIDSKYLIHPKYGFYKKNKI
jgi:hypothetical protein